MRQMVRMWRIWIIFLENVAIATVADVMDLTEENRILVKQGLEMLKRTSNLGLRADSGVSGWREKDSGISQSDLFLLRCLNASGKLGYGKKTHWHCFGQRQSGRQICWQVI